MPVISRWMIRSSLIYLFLGTLMGAVMLIHKAYPLHPAVWQLLPLHIEITLFGWIIQLTLGTGYWMLPRFLKAPHRGSKKAAIVMVMLLNTGIWLNVMADILTTEIPVQLIGRGFELSAVVIFLMLHWNRIVTYRNI